MPVLDAGRTPSDSPEPASGAASANVSAEGSQRRLAPTTAGPESIEQWFFCGGGDVMRTP